METEKVKRPNHPKKTAWAGVLRAVSFVFLLVAAVSGYLFFREFEVYKKGSKAYDSIAQAVLQNVSGKGKEMPAAQITEQTQVAQAALEAGSGQINSGSGTFPTPTLNPDQIDYQRVRALVDVDFERLKAINPDAIGWIFSENTTINYPLVQGRDNIYYLNHLVNNEYNKLGSIFIDYRNKPDFGDEHTFIFGHNMNDGSMFYDLEKYKDPAYFEKHPFIYILTKQTFYRIEVFAGYVTNPQNIGELYFNFASPEAKERYVSEGKLRSNFHADITVGEKDKIVSLFTCDYSTEDARFIVLGKLVPLYP
ncbi:MAG: class B sortase [Anaerolineaceae bacterium]|nr:class B sortase [Anaerolineaceae bacterium]